MGKWPFAACGIAPTGEFKISDGDKPWTNYEVVPARTEEVKELFDKMEDAGYRWDYRIGKLGKLIKDGNIPQNDCVYGQNSAYSG